MDRYDLLMLHNISSFAIILWLSQANYLRQALTIYEALGQ